MSAAPLVDRAILQAALARWCDALEAATPELNALDGRLGDGDLGTTLSKCAAHVRQALAAPADSLHGLLMACAKACARASGSSFGTLLAVGFMRGAQFVGRSEALDRGALVEMLTSVAAGIAERGGAAPGDKTMLDSLHAIVAALRECPPDVTPQAATQATLGAARAALDTFRDRPNRIGRARMFAERSIGLDDPGMVAVQRMAEAL